MSVERNKPSEKVPNTTRDCCKSHKGVANGYTQHDGAKDLARVPPPVIRAVDKLIVKRHHTSL
jgi:hypothetical protein